LAHEPHTPLASGQTLFGAKRGDRVPLNALTSWAQLGDLIKAFNDSQAAHNPPLHIDPSLKALRDAFAHGRIVGNDSLSNLIMMRFAKPKGAEVFVEERHELTLEWMKAQSARVREALQIAYLRLIEFPTQSSVRNGV
jgi:hypothetical protein